MQFHPLPDSTRQRLLDGGLDPDAVVVLVRMALDEDLMGGLDVTSAATVPPDQRSVGTIGSRGHGVVAGLAVAAAAIDVVCGDDASDVEYLVDDGDRVSPGDEVARVIAPDAWLAHCRAHGVEPALSPVRRGHADASMGRRPRWDRLRRS